MYGGRCICFMGYPADLRLGKSIPDSAHAISVSLPTWESVIGYEEGDERVIQTMQAGYPRFFLHPYTRELFSLFGERAFVFPSKEVGQRALHFIGREYHLKTIPGSNLCYLDDLHDKDWQKAKEYWQHTGEIISSRQALSHLNNASKLNSFQCKQIKYKLKGRLASFARAKPEDIFLFPTGMAAIASAHRLINKLHPRFKTVQFGFPYVDTLRIQQKFGAGVHLFPKGDKTDLQNLKTLLSKEKIAALFCEFPSNPLLHSVDLKSLRRLADKYGFFLIIDDTISGFCNVDLSGIADILVSSLTKFFSGSGEVMGGSLILGERAGLIKKHRFLRQELSEDLLWAEDAAILLSNSSSYLQRMKKINSNTKKVVEFLASHQKVKEVYYPSKVQSKAIYKDFQIGGYGGLFSVRFHREADAISFYNTLRLAKGPSLGTSFSLVCPYVLLAHYHEMDFVRECGIDPSLIRISIGTESVDSLLDMLRASL